VPAWQSILDYLADVIRLESVQKRALKIVFPAEEPYTGGPGSSKLGNTVREKRRLVLQYVEKMKSRDHTLFQLLPRPVAGTCNYKLRKNSEKFLLFNGTITCRTKRTVNM